MRERALGGWVFGEPRSNTAKRHPDLVPWEELTEPSREKDREAVTAIPGLLADVGLAVVRVSPNSGTSRHPGGANGHPPPGAGLTGIAGTTPAGSPSAR
jgi:hypothetical protein